MQRVEATKNRSFERKLRLLTATDYQKVFEGGQRSSGPLITLVGRYNNGETARLGLAISRKQVKKAVDRNRIKRQMRESFRIKRASLPAVDIIVMARKEARVADNATLRDAFEKQIRRWSKQNR